MHVWQRGKNWLIAHGGWLFLLLALLLASLSLAQGLKRVDSPFAGFFYGPNLLVSVAQRANWPGPREGLKSLDQLVAIDGVAVADWQQASTQLARRKIGQRVQYTVLRQKQSLQFNLPLARLTWKDLLVVFLAPFFIGLLFLANGVLVLATRPKEKVTLLFFSFCFTIGLFYITLFEANTSYNFFWVTVCYPIFGALATHLFLHFPKRFVNPALRLPLLIAAYAGALILILLRLLWVADAGRSIVLSHLSSLYMGMSFLSVVGLLCGTYISERRSVLRRRIKVLLPAVILSSLVGVIWVVKFVFSAGPFYLDEALSLSLFLPILMSYAILKENLFDIDSVIRRGVIYGLLSALIFGLYLLFVSAVSWFSPQHIIAWQSPFFALLAMLVLVLLFNPLRRLVQTFAYRVVFPGKYKYLNRLNEFGEKLRTGMSLSSLSKLLVDEVCLILDLEQAVLFCAEKGEAQPLTFRRGFGPARGLGARRRKIDADCLLVKHLAAETRPFQPQRDPPNFDCPICQFFQQQGFAILVPLAAGEGLLGILALGGKRGEELFSEEDLNFLQVVTRQGSIALENALLYEEMARHEQLAAVGRLASVIVHEVKNPLSVIKVSSGTIRRLAGDNEKIKSLSHFIEDEVQRMNETIVKILNFANPREAVLESVDAFALVDEIAGRYRDSLQDRGVKIELFEPIEPVFFHGDREKIGRALANLLLNAAQSMPQGGSVQVGLKADQARQQLRISVTDQGGGISEELQEKIFDPFFSTREGGGGLGLAIVRRIMQEHGGQVTLTSKPGRGASFSLDFPLAIKGLHAEVEEKRGDRQIGH